ncbi:unnamed protein product [Trifolium pratense]|uniref:Uncharacterized protein n=1 Tax=Trifolium pratense TaxID=57577 RepID=A0ACB0L938_TRIPR|nr:unnamed protein product [Trifolium pratense]
MLYGVGQPLVPRLGIQLAGDVLRRRQRRAEAGGAGSVGDNLGDVWDLSDEVAAATEEYRWKKRGSGDLLLLANPLHIQLLCDIIDCDVTVLTGFKYKSIDGDLVGILGDSWFLKTDPVYVTWHSTNGVKKEYHKEIVYALLKDVEEIDSSAITTTSSYFYGKLIARAARLALIAEEVFLFDMILKVKIKKFLKETIEPWLDGTFNGNGFLYDHKWGGIVTKQGCADSNDYIGTEFYNAQLNQLGYFLYGIAVLVKLDPDWGRKFKPQAYSLMEDFMNLNIILQISNCMLLN